MPFDYSTLVTDRVQADVDAQNSKGCYDYTVLNRVTQAIEDLTERFSAYGYNVGNTPVLIAHTDGTKDTVWREDDESLPIELFQVYLNNVANLNTVFNTATSSIPGSIEFLTVDDANSIEKLLLEVNKTLEVLATTFVPCGETACGDYNL